MSNSSLVSYTKLSPNITVPRNHVIDTITIHCMAGNLTIERCGEVFSPTSRKASSNYGVDSDGRIAMYVEEKNRSWCTSNSANDHRAITIEVANDGGAPDWHVSDKAMEALIELCADICKRNNIKKLVWSTNKEDRVNHRNGCNMTVHRDYAAKACPGEYLYSRHGYIADEVNKRLGVASSVSQPISQPQATVTPLKVTSSVDSIQKWLNKHYSAGLTVDGKYGNNTRKALVKAWQKEVGGLIIDGVFGPKSLQAASKCILNKGSKGIFVTIWQAALVCNKYNPNGIDGIFGIGCVNATLAYKTKKLLPKDSTVSPETWETILTTI